MKTIRFALGSFLFVALLASASMAQAQRTFVSGLGSDANPCTRTAPCRTFAQAVAGTSRGGEVVVLDSAGYGPVTITQSVSIIAPPGVYAGISALSGSGIIINASGDTVILRGLTLSSQNGNNGILFHGGGTLHVENCIADGFFLGLSFSGPGNLEVKDSIMRGGVVGIVVSALGSPLTAFATIDNVRLEENASFGLQVAERAKVTIRNSVAFGSGNIGLEAKTSAANSPSELNVENCVVSNNFTGIASVSFSTGVGTIVRVSNTTVTHNGAGLLVDANCFLLSRGNNTVEGNQSDTLGTIGSYTPK
jgi:hypothetical protein